MISVGFFNIVISVCVGIIVTFDDRAIDGLNLVPWGRFKDYVTLNFENFSF